MNIVFSSTSIPSNDESEETLFFLGTTCQPGPYSVLDILASNNENTNIDEMLNSTLNKDEKD